MGLLRERLSSLKSGRKIQASELVGLGTTGNIYYVIKSTDSFYAKFKSQYDVTYKDGSSAVCTTIAAAYAKCVTGRNDVIAILPGSHALTAMLEVTINNVHFIGVDIQGRLTAARSRIVMGVTTDTDDISAIKNTGNGNSFTNLKIVSENTLAQNLSAFLDAGEATVFNYCSFHNLGSAHLTNANAAPLILAGDGSVYNECEIGADTVQSTAANGQVILIKHSGTSYAKRVVFNRCNVLSYTNKTTHAFVRVAADTDVDRFVQFKDCSFINFYTSSNGALMAIACATPSGLTSGIVIFEYPRIIGATDLASAAVGNDGQYVIGTTATAASDGIAVKPTA